MKNNIRISFRIFFISLLMMCGTLFAQTTNINTNSSQAAAGNRTAPTTNVLLYYFTFNLTSGSPNFTAITNFTTSGTYIAADISNLKLWVSNFEFFGGGSLVTIATLTTGLGPGAHTFTFTNPLPAAPAQRYFWITTDIKSTAVCGSTIRCDLITSAMFTVTGTKNYGTNNAAGLQTVLGGTCIATPAPIELISFKGKKNGEENTLEWITATETNNDYFTLERSSDAIHFENITFVEGAGNSNSLLSYYYTDPFIKKDQVYYYRLKQTDFDHQFSYSEIISIKAFAEQDKPPVAYFDHASEMLEVKFAGEYSGRINFEIIDLLGRRLFSEQLNTNSENSTYTLPFSQFIPGIYIVKLSGENDELLGQCKFLK
jgi:hypothetical protein